MTNALLVTQILNWSSINSLFITLNTVTNDRIKFEGQLSKIAHKLNDFCYGRSYQRSEKKLKIIASIETGKLNGLLHAHLIVCFDDESKRTLHEINAYVRNHWSLLIGINNPFGSMVDVRNIGELSDRVSYLVKDTQYWLRNDVLNLVVL